MALLTLRQVRIAFGGPLILDGIDLQFERDERICLVGRNGTGKSTLMKLIHGDLEADAGQIVRPRDGRSALLPQDLPAGIEGTVLQIATDGAPDAPHHQVESAVSRLQLDPDADFATLSGGLQRRALLARALASEPEILLLDEPTNHLDIDSIAWLEDFLLRWRGTLIFTSHDRAFLQRLATRIVELDRGRAFSYPGNYDTYLQRRDERLDTEATQNAVFDDKLAEEETWIRQGIKARRTRNEGRVRALLQMRDQHHARRQKPGGVRLQVQEAERSGDLVIETQDLNFAYADENIVRDFSTLIRRGDKIGVIGPNGSGKTTLLRLLLGQLQPQAGQVRHGTRLHVAFFDQLRQQLNPDLSVVANIGNQEYLDINGTRRHIYGYLQDFLFTPERARTPVAALSGGERNRLLLARLFTQPANLLIMDEPTNDLDAETLELLEERLLDYPGTLLLVSHDRAFLDHVATSLLVFEGEGRVGEYVGGYSDWLQRHAQPQEEKKQKIEAPRRERQRQRRLGFGEKRELEELPGRIETLEEEQQELHQRLADPAFYQGNGTAVAALTERLQTLESELKTAYARWEELAELET